MGILLPDKEIKQTLANADVTLASARNVVTTVNTEVLPRVNVILTRVDGILADLGAITGALREIFVKPRS